MPSKDILDIYKLRHNKINIIDDIDFQNHQKKYSFFDSGGPHIPGQIFLYEKLDKKEIFYPKIAVYLNSTPVDQTLNIEYFNLRRSWEFRTPYDLNARGYLFADLPSVIDNTIIWDEDLFVYGVWDKLPDWKILRSHYEMTWWYHKNTQQKRQNTIESILKK